MRMKNRKMTYYEDIEKYLENTNADDDILVTIDDIDKGSITFSVYDSEVTNESLATIYQVLQYVGRNEADLNTLSTITHYPSKNGNAECFNLRFELYVGDDEESEEELRQKAIDDDEDRRYKEYKESKIE